MFPNRIKKAGLKLKPGLIWHEHIFARKIQPARLSLARALSLLWASRASSHSCTSLALRPGQFWPQPLTCPLFLNDS